MDQTLSKDQHIEAQSGIDWYDINEWRNTGAAPYCN